MIATGWELIWPADPPQVGPSLKRKEVTKSAKGGYSEHRGKKKSSRTRGLFTVDWKKQAAHRQKKSILTRKGRPAAKGPEMETGRTERKARGDGELCRGCLTSEGQEKNDRTETG